MGLATILVALFALSPSSAIAGTACTPATNIEAIIDDSGSMGGTDFNALRVQGLKLLMAKSENAQKTLGAIEFGGGTFDPIADPNAINVFLPGVIGPNAAAFGAALDANIKADHGTTDYNSAFALANTHNPNATARIFLTDGGHNEGDYADGHKGGPRTFVIGLGIGAVLTSPESVRLQQIATDTGGTYYPNVTQSTLQARMNDISDELNCFAKAQSFTDIFTKLTQTKTRTVKIGSKSKSITLVLTWDNPLDKFTIGSIVETIRGGRKLKGSRRLKVTRTEGATFLNVKISGLKKGKLKFKLRPLALGSGQLTGVTLTTQATQSRRR